MPLFSDPNLPLKDSKTWSGGLAGIRVRDETGFFLNSKTPFFDLNDASFSGVPPVLHNYIPNLPNMSSINGTGNISLSDPSVLAPSLRTVSLCRSIRAPASCYLDDSIDNAKHEYLSDKKCLEHSFSNSPLYYPNIMSPQPPSNFDRHTFISSFSSNGQFLDNHVMHEAENLDQRGKPVFGVLDNLSWSDINPLSPLTGRKMISILKPYSVNSDALLHRFNGDSLSALPTDNFCEPNDQINGVYHLVSEPTGLESEAGTKRKASEGEERQVKKSNSHRCKLCNMSFSTGNALGGHMSYHAKKKKLEAQINTQALRQQHGSEQGSVSYLAFGLQHSVIRSMNSYKW